MTQQELDQAVADATSESLGTVRRRGFSIVQPLEVLDLADDCAQEPQTVDWDALADTWSRRVA